MDPTEEYYNDLLTKQGAGWRETLGMDKPLRGEVKWAEPGITFTPVIEFDGSRHGIVYEEQHGRVKSDGSIEVTLKFTYDGPAVIIGDLVGLPWSTR